MKIRINACVLDADKLPLTGIQQEMTC